MGLFSSKKIEPVITDPRNPQRQQVDAFLANYVSQYGPQYQPGKAYGGQFTAGMSGFEGRGLDQFLSQYLNEGVSGQTGDVRNLLNQTITGGFDPGTSQYYQALRNASQYNRGQAIRDTNADLGARGKYFSSEAVNKYGDINAQTANTLNLSMAELANQERNRSMSAVPQALGLEQFLAGIPLQKATAAMGLGALPRELEQADMEQRYQDWKRQQGELGQVINASQGVSQTQMQQTAPAYKPSTFESFIAPLLTQAIPALLTGGASLPFTGAASLFGGGGGFNPATMSSSQVMPGGFGAWR